MTYFYKILIYAKELNKEYGIGKIYPEKKKQFGIITIRIKLFNQPI